MTGISRALVLVFAFLLFLTCTAGCTFPRVQDTHNTTAVIKSYNAWASSQGNFSHETEGTVSVIGRHIQEYNAEIVKERPDYSLLHANLVQDRQLIDTWRTRLNSLSAATGQFEQETSTLVFDNASAGHTTGRTLAQLTQHMKIYTVNMGNAQQHLIEYVENAEAYIGPGDPDYWDETYRQNAMLAKDDALKALTDSDTELEAIHAQALQLESYQ